MTNPLTTSKQTILDGLNEKQKLAVLHEEGPLLVVAGAGTGKTLVITRRIAWLITSKKAKPQEILALTFTEKAATEMEERVDILIPYGYAEVWISTFHAFGDRVLKEEALELGLSSDLRVLSQPEQAIFFREHLFEFPLDYYRPLGNPTRYIAAMVNLFNRAKDEDVSPDEYLTYAQELKEKAEDPELLDYASRQCEIAVAYKKYQELLATHGRIDFGDQVSYALRLFRERPSILRKYRERFKYILVDEFQDTNYAQFQLLKLLAGPNGNITVVGDDDQSIYKFRGAAISNILGFMGEYPQAEQVVLTENYRSTQVILDTAYKLIKYNDPERLELKNDIDKRLTAQSGGGREAEILYYDTSSAEADGVAKIIHDKGSSNDFSYGDVAILVRSNNDADPFLRSLNMKGIPWRFSGNKGLYDREEVKLLISFLKVVANFEDSVSLYHLANCEVYKISPVDLVKCMSWASRKNRSLYWCLAHSDELSEFEELKDRTKEKVQKLIGDIEHYVQLSVNSPTGGVLYQFITESGYLEGLVSAPSTEKETKVKNIARFFEVVKSIGEIVEPDRVPQFVAHLDMLIQSGDNPPVAEADLDQDAVNVLTVHRAKGLEFRIVFLTSLVSGRFPWPRRSDQIELPEELVKESLPSGDYHLQEERRLFYVGMTRAKEELYLTAARDYGGARPRKVSQFVLEALDLPKGELPIYKSSALEAIKRHAPQVSSPEAGYSPVPDEAPMTLSYYQIDDYLTCPLKYKYVHILRVPILQHHSVIYGKALHDAVREYNLRRATGRTMTVDELISVFEDSWVSEGFLTREHEEQRLEVGRAALRSFHKTQEASSIIPAHVERPFSFTLENNKIVGRWDRIDEVDGEVAIIDFKSSEVRHQKDADDRTRKSLQLEIYALAYNELFGTVPDRVELHFLESGLVGVATLSEKRLNKTREKILEAASGIRSRELGPNPTYKACTYCAYSGICPHSRRGR